MLLIQTTFFSTETDFDNTITRRDNRRSCGENISESTQELVTNQSKMPLFKLYINRIIYETGFLLFWSIQNAVTSKILRNVMYNSKSHQ